MRARLAIAAGNLDEAEKLLRKSVRENPADLAAFLALRYGTDFNPQRELAALPALTDSEKDNAAMVLFRAAGNLDRSADSASELSPAQNSVARLVLIQAENYQALSRFDSSGGPYYSLDNVIAGHLLHLDDTVAHIVRDANSNNKASINFSGTFANLDYFLLADYPADAVHNSFMVRDGHNVAFHLLAQQLWIRDAIAAIPKFSSPDISMARQLNDLGLAAAARRVFNVLPLPHTGEDAVNLGGQIAFVDELERASDAKAAGGLRKALIDYLSALKAHDKSVLAELKK